MAETLGNFLEESAAQFGDQAAILFKPGLRYRRWSYKELWTASGRVATYLLDRGLQKGDRALLWGPNSPYWVLAFFGCLRAGIVAVPLDVRSAEDFVGRVISKSQPVLAFVSRFTVKGSQELQIPRVFLEDLEDLTTGLGPPAPVELSSSDLAEIMFTSGTTGDPKGVMLSHANILADLEALRHYVPGKPSYRLISLLPLSHMLEQVGGLLMALACGANITYPTSQQPGTWVKTMRERRVTTLLLIPQGLELFMNSIEREVRRQGRERLWKLLMRVSASLPFLLRRYLFGRVHRRFGGKLESILSGGAALDPQVARKWELVGVKVLQGYGATEASPVIACHPLARWRYDSVGLPLPGVEVKVAADGEVLVRGPNIMQGYWEAPELTAAAFQDGWYKTGDLGFFDRAGFLHLKGRKKDMIVLPNGQNVYPEDIEAVLKRHPAVADCTVVALPKASAVEVHAALIMRDPSVIGEAVGWANAQLAEHQRVRGFTLWLEEDFPRTHTLKVKKPVIIDVLKGSITAPSSPSLTKQAVDGAARGLVQLIAEISHLPPSEITPEKQLSNDLNLDSLGRVELLSAIEEELGIVVDESQSGPDITVKALQQLVERGSQDMGGVAFPQWGMAPWTRLLRDLIQHSIVFPLLAITYRLRITGREHLANLNHPVLLASNHTLPLDNGIIIKGVPSAIRRRLAIAAAAEIWRSPLWRVVNPLVGNGFPFARSGPVRPSLENLGRILDKGWSVLIYPEGELTVGGPMKPFKSGTGLIAIESNTPVVPLRVYVHRLGSPWQFPIWRRGEVEVRFGPPMRFGRETSYVDATQAIEAAVKAL